MKRSVIRPPRFLKSRRSLILILNVRSPAFRLSNEILKGVFKEGSKAIVDLEEEKIVFKGGQKKKKTLETVETSS